MSNRADFYFRQRVTEAELDLAFDQLEQADRTLASDIGVYGIISGAVPVPHTPVANLSIDLTAPARAYDRAGQRIAFGAGLSVDCSVDLNGVPTTVLTPGNERWVGVFLRFARLLSDPRTDGNSQQVYFRRDEHFELVVRQAADSVAGAAPRMGLPDAELLVCDVRIAHGQTQILAGDIDTARRQAFIFAQGDAVAVEASSWATLAPAVATVQASLDAVDDELTGHFTGTTRRHAASDIDFTAPAEIAGSTVQAAISDLVSRLVSASGISGGDFVRNASMVGTPYALGAGAVRAHVQSLLGWLNGHVGAAAGAHAASAISAAVHAWVTGTSVQAQLQEIVSELTSTLATKGGARVGQPALSGSPYALALGTVASQLQSLLGSLNTHVGGSDHDTRYWRRVEQVADADTVDGQHAAAFALAGHDHDARYLRKTFQTSMRFEPGDSLTVTTLVDKPDIVLVAYNLFDGMGLPQASTYGRGVYTDDIYWWVTKVSSGGDKDYEIHVFNNAPTALWISIAAYARD